MVDKIENKQTNKLYIYMSQVGVLWRLSFLFEGLRLPNKLNLWEVPLATYIPMLAAMSFFHLCLKLSTREVLAVV